jgi:hypothetical protein
MSWGSPHETPRWILHAFVTPSWATISVVFGLLAKLLRPWDGNHCDDRTTRLLATRSTRFSLIRGVMSPDEVIQSMEYFTVVNAFVAR